MFKSVIAVAAVALTSTSAINIQAKLDLDAEVDCTIDWDRATNFPKWIHCYK